MFTPSGTSSSAPTLIGYLIIPLLPFWVLHCWVLHRWWLHCWLLMQHHTFERDQIDEQAQYGMLLQHSSGSSLDAIPWCYTLELASQLTSDDATAWSPGWSMTYAMQRYRTASLAAWWMLCLATATSIGKINKSPGYQTVIQDHWLRLMTSRRWICLILQCRLISPGLSTCQLKF